MKGKPGKVGDTYIWDGYVLERVENHPGFPGKTWVTQHHLVWWKYRRERVPRGYVLHHKDENRANNKIGNLKLMTNAEHVRLHSTNPEARERARVRAIAQYANPEARERARIAANSQWANPEARALASSRAKAQWARRKGEAS